MLRGSAVVSVRRLRAEGGTHPLPLPLGEWRKPVSQWFARAEGSHARVERTEQAGG